MPLYKTPAIILRAAPFGESDQLITLYTLAFGKIKGIAKSAKRSRKRFGNTLETASYVLVTFFEKENADLVRLSHCDLIRPFASLRQDIHRLAQASYFIELVSVLTADRIKNQMLFDLLIAFLTLADQSALREENLHIFEIRILSHLGYQPQFHACTRCQTGVAGERVFFSASAGGILCPDCATNLPSLVPVSLGTLKTLLMAQTLPLSKIGRIVFSPQSLRESQALLSLFLQQYLGKELKTKKFLEQM